MLKASWVEECPCPYCLKSLSVVAAVAASIACLSLHCCILFLCIIIIIMSYCKNIATEYLCNESGSGGASAVKEPGHFEVGKSSSQVTRSRV